MTEHPIKNILVVGDTLEGWMSAAFLAQQFKNTGVKVRLCAHEDQNQSRESVVVGTPSLAHFHTLLNLDERDIVKFCKGIFRLGTQYENWHKGGKSTYIHSYNEQAESLNGVAFHHHWLRLRQSGNKASFDTYSLGANMGRAKKFRHPMDDDKKLRASFAYGYHFGHQLYTSFMRKCALHYGAVEVEASAQSVQTDKFGLTSITLANGTKTQADLYLDCTGNGQLIDVLQSTQKWKHWAEDMPFKEISTVHYATITPQLISSPLAHVKTFSHGWVQELSLQSGSSKTCVHTEDSADILPKILGTEDISTTQLNIGKHAAPWQKNCIAVGRSACRLAPLEGPNMRLTEVALMTLRDLFPVSTQDAGERTEYNRILNESFDRFRDFQIAHYRLVGHQGEFWDTCAALPISDKLAVKLEQFESRGRVVMYDHESFNAESWTALFLGQGLMPKRYDPLAEGMPMTTLEKSLHNLRDRIEQVAATQLYHLDYITRARALTPMKAT